MRWRWLLRMSLPFSPEKYFDTIVVDRSIDSFSSLARNFTWIHKRSDSWLHYTHWYSAFGGSFMFILRKIYIQINRAPMSKNRFTNFTLEFSGRLACVALNWRGWRHFSNDSWNFVLKRKRSKYTVPPPQQQHTHTTPSWHIHRGKGGQEWDGATDGLRGKWRHTSTCIWARKRSRSKRTAQKDKPNKNQNKAATKAK